jgi:hypothetical protein
MSERSRAKAISNELELSYQKVLIILREKNSKVMARVQAGQSRHDAGVAVVCETLKAQGQRTT